ncbi:MAG: hypothetical protein ACFFCI_14475 [Promethearchaeota archaeon]
MKELGFINRKLIMTKFIMCAHFNPMPMKCEIKECKFRSFRLTKALGDSE